MQEVSLESATDAFASTVFAEDEFLKELKADYQAEIDADAKRFKELLVSLPPRPKPQEAVDDMIAFIKAVIKEQPGKIRTLEITLFDGDLYTAPVVYSCAKGEKIEYATPVPESWVNLINWSYTWDIHIIKSSYDDGPKLTCIRQLACADTREIMSARWNSMHPTIKFKWEKQNAYCRVCVHVNL